MIGKYYDWYAIQSLDEKEFKEWWKENKNNFNWNYSYRICVFCYKHFKIWYDPDKFDWVDSPFLKKYCQDYKYLWEKDYLFYNMKKN